jgi:hypothetical protein
MNDRTPEAERLPRPSPTSLVPPNAPLPVYGEVHVVELGTLADIEQNADGLYFEAGSNTWKYA